MGDRQISRLGGIYQSTAMIAYDRTKWISFDRFISKYYRSYVCNIDFLSKIPYAYLTNTVDKLV